MRRDGIGYPHRLRITRPGTGGSQDPDTGEWTPATEVVAYDDWADVQDAGEAVPRTATGQPVKESDATAFLKDEEAGLEIAVDDKAVVTYPDGRYAEGEVKFVRDLDGAVLIRYR